MRHFALKGLFDVFLTSKEENIAFPPPSPPRNVVPLLELPLEKKNTPTLNGGDRGGVWILTLSEVTLLEYVSTILSLTRPISLFQIPTSMSESLLRVTMLRSLVYPYYKIDIEQDEICKALLINQDTE